MLSYTTRIVLYDANRDDYERLHQYMEAVGFARTITSEDGKKYQLPDAEYDFSGKEKRDEVLIKAKVAAAATTKKYSVLVTESAGRTWFQLDPV